jgi:hypothetical protein
MHLDEKDGKEILVCTAGKTVLHYGLWCLADLHAMLPINRVQVKKHGDRMEQGSADNKSPPKKAP